ncbi:MAG: hypothetical protein IJA86_01650 [Clostridia bacterium]|nr:hypothetical protein [Clostridia bacterium]
MKTTLICDLFLKENNPRNSEGSFFRAPTGEILFSDDDGASFYLSRKSFLGYHITINQWHGLETLKFLWMNHNKNQLCTRVGAKLIF